jgi:Fe2+ or Zn2+ uptake regulation protein
MALRHALAGRRIIAAQRERVARLLAQGRNTTEAEQLLSQYERTQAIFEDDLERLTP